MNTETTVPQSQRELTLFDLWLVVWRGRWIILLVTALFVGLAVGYALTATKWYSSYAILMHADQDKNGGLKGQLSGLAALANVGGFDSGGSSDEAIAVLRSRDFAAEFIRANDLTATFTEFGLDDQEKAALAPEDHDIREAIRFFHENVFRLQEDQTTGAITLRIFWTDPDVAAKWAADVVRLINERMRQRALRDASANVKFLEGELASTPILPLQQSIGNLLEHELQSLMMARGNADFAFRIIDPPLPPTNRARPRRTLIVATAGVLGGVFSVVLVFVISALRRPAR